MVNRRQSPRTLLLTPPVYVLWGETKSELLFDLSESGLAIYGHNLAGGRSGIPIEFRLSGNSDPIVAKAEIAWTSRSRNLTGMRFTQIADDSREHLRTWIAARARGVSSYSAEYHLPGLTSRMVEAFRARSELSNKPGILAAGSAFVALIFLAMLLVVPHRHHYRAAATIPKPTAIVAVKPLESPQSVSNSHDSSSVEDVSFGTGSNPMDVPGFVLQVGAMIQEHNADELSASLRQLGFPVIVFRHSTDRFYRVAVGPYSDITAANRVKGDLKLRNVNAIVKPWVPE